MIKDGIIIENEIGEIIKKVEQEHNVELSTIQKILLCIKGHNRHPGCVVW